MRSQGKMNAFCGSWLLFPMWILCTIPIGFAYYCPAVFHPVMIIDLCIGSRSAQVQ